ncbi:Autophagy-related protein 3 [Intoshia linei]|uniref:Ubiquitin-like-conjugating enzyme ATG3 n=1 Tax=Intoshia linei TaxID=1819745 RepID=A0A177BBZ6_9BILA|nr:Autophagy-related protein 3 [Intoshia linei]
MQDVKNLIQSKVLDVATYLTPVLKDSKFRETGRITPDEFVAAGDHLVYHCPTWKWFAGIPANKKSYLPDEKQFLITNHVPCHSRIKTLNSHDLNYEKKLDGEFEDWIDTHFYAPQENTVSKDLEISQIEPVAENNSSDSEDALDMDDFMNSDEIKQVDPSRYTIVKKTESNKILKTRTYNLNITYDKYYQTSRLWLEGYNANKESLSPIEMFEDFSQDHANKTITIEKHPHSNSVMASIHPCKHANVMKRMISLMEVANKELSVVNYIIIFLKFVQSIIPTINYDFTQNIIIIIAQMSRRYDSKTTIFSPEGRLYQVEYAMEAINEAGLCVGITTPDGILIGAEQLFNNPMLDIKTHKEKIYRLNKNIICGVAGITSDASLLINKFRMVGQQYELAHQEPIPVEQLVRIGSDQMHAYTQFGGYRPFGVSFLIAGWDDEYKYQLYQNDPSGNYSGMKATSIGRDSPMVMTALKEEYNYKDMNLEKAKKMIIKLLMKPQEINKVTVDMFEIAYLKKDEDGISISYFDKEVIQGLIDEHKDYLLLLKAEQEQKEKERQRNTASKK